MPHIVIEHSTGLEISHDLQSLCDVIWQGFADHASVNGPDTVRVRCIAATASRIGVEPQSFAHATVLLLPGRSDAHRNELAQLVMDAMIGPLADVGSLTVRLTDLNPPYLKRML